WFSDGWGGTKERKQRHFLAGIGSCSMPSKISTARGGTTHSGAWRRRQAAMVVRRCVTNGAGWSGQRCSMTVDVRQRAMKTAGAWFRQQWRTGTRVASSGWEARYSGVNEVAVRGAASAGGGAVRVIAKAEAVLPRRREAADLRRKRKRRSGSS
ncbi:hypothetical protein U1Q18_003574, partial [Sarracenia purpurea var. burkii]